MPLSQRRPYTRNRTRSPSTSEEEIDVDQSLPSSPVDPSWSTGPDQAGTSRAYRFALENEGVRRYAREAFDEPPSRMENMGMKQEEGKEELREMNQKDQEYLDNQAYIGDPDIRLLPDDQPGHLRFDQEQEEEEDEEEAEDPPDQRQCRICFSGREEEAVLGRLISPCLCSGSMRVSRGVLSVLSRVSRVYSESYRKYRGGDMVVIFTSSLKCCEGEQDGQS